MMAKLVRTFLLSLLAGSPLLAQAQTPNPSPPPGRTLTLAQAEALALKNNPRITIGKLRALAAQQYVREARSALMPNAYLSLTAVDANPGSRLAAGSLT